MDKDTLFYKKHTISCRGRLLNIEKPVVMGIMNITPDSFYKQSRVTSAKDIVNRAGNILAEGGSIIDVGAYSSRPGADEITVSEEKDRLKPALEAIRENFPDAFCSIDTFRAEIAEWAIDKYHVDIINDISGGKTDPELIDVVAGNQVPYITMHMQGQPLTMQQNPAYSHVVKDIVQYFAEHIAFLRTKALNDIIIDPGFGFGKTLEQNYQLLAGLDVFQMLELPVLVGLSRKSMIYKLLGSSPENALAGTIAMQLVALQKGAQLLRVHDVKEAVETISIYEMLQTVSEKSINLLHEQ